MKCIQYYRPFGGQIKRVTDDVAKEAIAKNEAMYVPKKLWKEKVRDAQVDS